MSVSATSSKTKKGAKMNEQIETKSPKDNIIVWTWVDFDHTRVSCAAAKLDEVIYFRPCRSGIKIKDNSVRLSIGWLPMSPEDERRIYAERPVDYNSKIRYCRDEIRDIKTRAIKGEMPDDGNSIYGSGYTAYKIDNNEIDRLSAEITRLEEQRSSTK